MDKALCMEMENIWRVFLGEVRAFNKRQGGVRYMI
jgi:hypothetical protein